MIGQTAMPPPTPDKDDKAAPKQPDWYLESGMLVFTAAYHLKRGYCCGSGCRHCPYEPRHVEGNREVRP
jgi:hypothetical protein